MTLDLTKVAGQVDGMLTQLKTSREERQQHLASARDAFGKNSKDFNKLQKKIAASKSTWLVAGLVESPDKRYPALPLPDDFAVIASDGSHIDIDRHRSAKCYLINTGGVILHYGARPDALLESQPRLYAGDEDMMITSPDGKGRGQAIEGNLLGIKRGVAE